MKSVPLKVKTHNHSLTFLLLFVLLHALAFAAPCRAQNRPYVIGPRDVLTLTIYAGGEKQQTLDLTVSAKGAINAPFLGAIEAAGLTIPQLEERITEPLAKDYFVDPEVNISVAEYHSLQYFISGAVHQPGLYKMTSSTNLMEIIARAGGVIPERGDVAYILRDSTEEMVGRNNIKEILSKKDPIKVDLESLLDRGDMASNLELKPGDVVYIPLGKTLDLARSKIYVGGKIEKPGLYDYQPGLTALSACILAGGFSKFSAPNRTKIIRKENGEQTIIEIKLDDVKEGKAPDVELKPGDRIDVPESWL